ncbi:MAG: RNA methyltransferase [Acidimicrobiia bacterium]|nr:RNA methyltransferase [Acidimicrobiia bacterium]
MITSLRNPRVAAARKLRRTRVRKESGLTLLEGPHLLEEALTAGVEIREAFALPGDDTSQQRCRDAGIPLTQVSQAVMDGLADSLHPRGPVGVIAIPHGDRIQPIDSVVMWEVTDPGNAGTIVRTAAAFGYQVIATSGTVDLWAPKVLRAGAGGHFKSPIIEGMAADTGSLLDAELRPIVAVADGRVAAAEAVKGSGSVALIVGNESRGVPEEVRTQPGLQTATLPMPGGMESLNAAVAAAILMYLRMTAS